MPRGEIFDGDRHKVSFTQEVEGLTKANVGEGKRFSSLSKCVCFCVVQVLGSELQRTEESQTLARGNLQKVLDRLKALKEKHGNAEIKAQVLSSIYQVPVSRAVELAEKAQADWKQHSDAGKCVKCSHQGNCEKAFGSGACWFGSFGDKEKRVWFASEDDIMSGLLMAVEVAKLQDEADRLKGEMRDFSSRGNVNA